MPAQLNNDLISLISMINASDNAVEKRRRLATTRITSQVCRSWRQVVLGSSPLWGRLVLLDELQSTEWIEEVLNRAGTSSPLWIEFNTNRNTLPNDHNRLLSDLLALLQNWDRIEVLHIITNHGFIPDSSLYKRIWPNMTRPAPILRSFGFMDPLVSSSDFNNPTALPQNLFGNYAPRLHTFVCYGRRISFKAAWVPLLETLYISPDSVDDIRNVLIWAPRLQEMGIKTTGACFSGDAEAGLSTLRSISSTILPCLSHIEANISLPAFNALWSLSSISSFQSEFSSQLTIAITTTSYYYNRDEIRQLPYTLDNIFRHRDTSIDSPSQPTRWTLNIRQCDIQIRALPASATTNRILNLTFDFGQAPDINMKTFLLSCLSPFLSNIKDFVLDISHPDAGFLSKELGNALLSMIQVRTITIRRNSLLWYNQIEESRGLLFPELKMVIKSNVPFYFEAFNQHRKQFLLFFRRRAQAGRVLPFVCTHDLDGEEMIRDLNRISGPRVRWNLSDNWAKDNELHWKYV